MLKFISALMVLSVVSISGCRGYQRGSLLHPQIRSIAVNPAINDTDVARLGPLLQAKLNEQIMTASSARLENTPQADVLIRSHIRNYQFTRVASAIQRDANARANDRDAYQAVVFHAQVTVDFEVVMPGDARPVLAKRTVNGQAEFAKLPDFITARDEALERATADAARQIIIAFSEAW